MGINVPPIKDLGAALKENKPGAGSPDPLSNELATASRNDFRATLAVNDTIKATAMRTGALRTGANADVVVASAGGKIGGNEVTLVKS